MNPKLVLLVFFSVWFGAARADPVAAAPRPELLKAAIDAAQAHRDQIHAATVLAIIDYSLPSNRPRLFLVDRTTGRSEAYFVAHGRGSDPKLTGMATQFSNAPESRMSSLGAYMTGGTYQGSHGLSMKLIGLDPTNSKAEERAIVLHGASYVGPGRSVLGRSWGCPAVEQRFVKQLIDRLKGGALLFVSR